MSCTKEPLRLDKEKRRTTEKILNIALEIIYLLTGEDYVVVKKTFVTKMAPNSHPVVSGGWSWTPSLLMVPPPYFLIRERNKDKKILQLSSQISALLTGEVPIRCQDVTVYFSMEEWEYLEGHKDLYKDVMMEDHQTLTSPDFLHGETCLPHSPSHTSIIKDQSCAISSPKPEEPRKVNITEVPRSHGEQGSLPIPNTSDRKGSTPSPSTQNPLTCIKSEAVLGEADAFLTTTSTPSWTIKEEPKEPPLGFHNPPQTYQTQSSTSRRSQTLSCGNDGLLECEYKSVIVKEEPGSCDHHQQHSRNGAPSKQGHLWVDHMIGFGHRKCYICNASLSPQELVGSRGGRYPYPTCRRCLVDNPPKSSPEAEFSEVNVHSCTLCRKSFVNKSHLLRHQRMHADDKLFACQECGKCLASKQNLDRHKRIHTGEKPYECSICKRSFAHKSAVIKHERIHTGERPYTCRECGKGFVAKSELVKHERTHTGEKPYCCAQCGKCFRRNYILRLHINTHTGERNFSCVECGRSFLRKYDLALHQKLHAADNR
ncbi:uncharacterized protein [Pyxicephalus adspersus]|uniref:uncharacterized protein isoform X3 n=1 Tax=Pyxicephalus adspersus TaxID=30357 RepID=UPI003B595B5B